MMKKKILFVTYGGGHVNIIRHVYKELRGTKYDCKIIALTSSVKTLDRENIQYSKISDYISLFKEKNEIIEYGEYLAKEHFDHKSGLDYNDLLVYLGMSFHDLVLKEGSFEEAIRIFKSYGRHIFNPVNTMSRIIAFENPSVVVLTSSMRMEKAAGIVANYNNIPVVRITDRTNEFDTLPYSAKVCVMNNIAKENLLKNNNIDPSQIFVTGQPDFEKSLELNEDLIKLIKNELNVEQFDKTIALMTQPSQNDTEVIVKEFKKLAQKYPKRLFLIKLHPNENRVDYHTILENQSRNNLKIITDYEASYIIWISDLIITKFSTIGLTAVQMDKPIISLNLLNENYSIDYVEYGVAKGVRDLRVLDSAINSLIDGSSDLSLKLETNRKKLLNTTNATKNVVKVIENQLYDDL